MSVIVDLSITKSNDRAEPPSRLAEIYPEGDSSALFHLRLPEDDPRTQMVMEELRRSGWDSSTNKSASADSSHRYWSAFWREYSHEDLVRCKWLLPLPLGSAIGLTRDVGGHIELDLTIRGFPEGCDLAGTGNTWSVIPDRVKCQLEPLGLRHVSFRETVLNDVRDGPGVPLAWNDYPESEPWWELSSDLVLPPMSPKMVILDWNKSRVSRGYEGPCFLKDPDDPRVRYPEPHYRMDDLRSVGDWDLALTFERTAARDDARLLIASKRFYDAWWERGLKADWVPVRLDSD